jgi:tetratricopeptide (TPR) repeat protein
MNPDQPTQPNSENPFAASDATAMLPEITPRQRYADLIEQTIANILQGKIRSKEQVYDLLVHQLESGLGEIFEQALAERMDSLQCQLTTTDELKQAKAERQMRALKTLQSAWEQWQRTYRVQNACSMAVQTLINTASTERLPVLIHFLDPNQADVFDHAMIQQLAQVLQETAECLPEESEALEMRQLGLGLKRGLACFYELEGLIVSWLCDPQFQVGFGASSQQNYGPWEIWAKQTSSSLARALFTGQAQNQSAAAIALAQPNFDMADWVELVVLLRGLQHGLVKWFDQQPYSIQAGRHMAGVTFLVFAMLWSELSHGVRQASQLSDHDRQNLSQGCFRITLQLLRTFAQRDNFPLYGGVFASFSGENFRETITYLDQPLKAVENTQEKARILTVLGYSQRGLGNHQGAISLHQEALDLARQVGDQPCEIANLNHLGRLSLEQTDFHGALSYAQRALILARQTGERQGEAHALASLGYSEVMLAQQQEQVSAENLEAAIAYLERAQKLAERLANGQNLALCYLGLGIGYGAIQQSGRAKPLLEQAILASQQIGDQDLQALSHAHLGETCYQLHQPEIAVYHTCLGMYLLEQRSNHHWRRAAALVIVLEGQLGSENFFHLLQQQRSQLIVQIGVDGFDHLPSLIQRYRQG